MPWSGGSLAILCGIPLRGSLAVQRERLSAGPGLEESWGKCWVPLMCCSGSLLARLGRPRREPAGKQCHRVQLRLGGLELRGHLAILRPVLRGPLRPAPGAPASKDDHSCEEEEERRRKRESSVKRSRVSRSACLRLSWRRPSLLRGLRRRT